MYNLVKLCVAGGGKTTKIIDYINELKKQNIDINRILLISYSNTTAQDLENKLKIKAYTLHSFCTGFNNNNSSILENYYHLIDCFKSKYTHLRYISTSTLNNWITNYELNYKQNIDFKQLCNYDIEFNYQFRSLIDNIYNNIYNQRSFTRILQHFYENIDDILPLINAKFDYLIVDEAQDLSSLQLKIVYKMIEEIFSYNNNGFMITGDKQQIIYGFQGASHVEYDLFIESISKLCILRNLKMEIEHHNTTYRFGGEIIEHINNKYKKHISNIKAGTYTSHIINDIDKICNIIYNTIEKYNIENVFVIFKKNTNNIINIQSKLENGMNVRIYLYGHILHQQLNLIYIYLTTYGKIRHMNLFTNSIFKYDSVYTFMHNICLYRNNNHLMFMYLNSIISIDNMTYKNIWNYLCYLSQSYTSFTAFFLNLPMFVNIKTNGIRFLTVHGSKGLETKACIFINENTTQNNIIIHKGILLKNTHYNEYTRNIYNEYMHEANTQLTNLYYVAITRATCELIEIIC